MYTWSNQRYCNICSFTNKYFHSYKSSKTGNIIKTNICKECLRERQKYYDLKRNQKESRKQYRKEYNKTHPRNRKEYLKTLKRRILNFNEHMVMKWNVIAVCGLIKRSETQTRRLIKRGILPTPIKGVFMPEQIKIIKKYILMRKYRKPYTRKLKDHTSLNTVSLSQV